MPGYRRQDDARREQAWNDLRTIGRSPGSGIPDHETGRRIIAAAHRRATAARSNARTRERYEEARRVVDPNGNLLG